LPAQVSVVCGGFLLETMEMQIDFRPRQKDFATSDRDDTE
jgi:hypothetical protein